MRHRTIASSPGPRLPRTASPPRWSRAAAALALLLLAACHGSSSPTEPLASIEGSAAAIGLATRLGDVRVFDHGCNGTLDLARIEAELYTTGDVAMRQNPSLAVYERQVLAGTEIHARTADATHDYCGPTGLACFEVVAGVGQMHVWCDGGGVEHETAHALGHGASLPCYHDVYHGLDFRCQPS